MGVWIRRATKADIDSYQFTKVPVGDMPTIIAWAGGVEDRVLGFGGLARINGRWIAFCDVMEEGRQYKFTIARTAKRVMQDAKDRGIKFVYADMDAKEDGAKRWAESLGFGLDPRTGILYRWRA